MSEDLLKKDSQSSRTVEDIVNEIKELDVNCDPRHLVEDAFIRRYASLWSLKYRTLKGKPITYKSTTNPLANRP